MLCVTWGGAEVGQTQIWVKKCMSAIESPGKQNYSHFPSQGLDRLMVRRSQERPVVYKPQLGDRGPAWTWLVWLMTQQEAHWTLFCQCHPQSVSSDRFAAV